MTTQRAKRASKLYHFLGTPSPKDFKMVITKNAIANNPVTTEDINLAEQIFGHNIRSLKGKTTRRKLIPIAQDYIKISIK